MKYSVRPHVVLTCAMALAACTRPDPIQEPVRAVKAMTVTAGTATSDLEFAAEIRARNEARLSFRVPGKLVERSAEVGQHVKAGQVLARIDPVDLKLAQDAARAATHSAEVALELAQVDVKRYRELRDQGFISSAELDRREASLRSARAQLEQAQAQAGVQVNQTGYSTLTTTSAGVVVALDAEVGAVLSAGTPVVRLALDGPRDVAFSVPEDVVERLKRQLDRRGAVQVKLWGGKSAVTAALREVGAAADPVTRTYLVKAELGSALAQLGQTASVTLPGEPTERTIRLPLTALMESHGRTAVWVFDRSTSTVKSRPILVAGADANDVIVASGVAVDEVVVTAGAHVLTEGQKVKLFQPASAHVPSSPSSAASIPAR